MGIALRQRADAPYMRRLEYLPPVRSLSIENDATLQVVAPRSHIFVVSWATWKELCLELALRKHCPQAAQSPASTLGVTYGPQAGRG